jgi:L-threonylcarbamoyladenylate synthase
VLRPRRRPPAALPGGPTLGIRVPAHPVALALVRRAGPLATTSANRSGRPPVRDAAGAAAVWPGRVVAVTGTSGGIPSTVADLTAWPPRVLREGRISAGRLRRLARRVETLTRRPK